MIEPLPESVFELEKRMSIQKAADQIVMDALDAGMRRGLRGQSPGEVEDRKAACIDRLKTLFLTENATALAVYASDATYRANLFGQIATDLRDILNKFVDQIAHLEEALPGDASVARDALSRLHLDGLSLVSRAVESGRILGLRVRASASGQMTRSPKRVVRDFAVQLYSKGTWKNPSDARWKLWAVVQAEAKRLGCPLSETEGSVTLYRWLLAHNKKCAVS